MFRVTRYLMISKTELGWVGYRKKYRVAGRVRVPAGHWPPPSSPAGSQDDKNVHLQEFSIKEHIIFALHCEAAEMLLSIELLTMIAMTISPAIAVRLARDISLLKMSLYFQAITLWTGVFFRVLFELSLYLSWCNECAFPLWKSI